MEQSFFAVARVTGPRGIRGEVKIEILSDNPQRFSPGARLFCQGIPYQVERRHVVAKHAVLKLQGIDTRNQAEALRDQYLEVPEEELQPLASDIFYVHQIIGLEVVTTDGERLGKVVEILQTGSNDVYVVQEGKRETLIPAIGQVVKEIEVERGRMVVQMIPGLLND